MVDKRERERERLKQQCIFFSAVGGFYKSLGNIDTNFFFFFFLGGGAGGVCVCVCVCVIMRESSPTEGEGK